MTPCMAQSTELPNGPPGGTVGAPSMGAAQLLLRKLDQS